VAPCAGDLLVGGLWQPASPVYCLGSSQFWYCTTLLFRASRTWIVVCDASRWRLCDGLMAEGPWQHSCCHAFVLPRMGGVLGRVRRLSEKERGYKVLEMLKTAAGACMRPFNPPSRRHLAARCTLPVGGSSGGSGRQLVASMSPNLLPPEHGSVTSGLTTISLRLDAFAVEVSKHLWIHMHATRAGCAGQASGQCCR
jgi:hypothetical protein